MEKDFKEEFEWFQKVWYYKFIILFFFNINIFLSAVAEARYDAAQMMEVGLLNKMELVRIFKWYMVRLAYSRQSRYYTLFRSIWKNFFFVT
jgi:hypothetical protein